MSNLREQKFQDELTIIRNKTYKTEKQKQFERWHLYYDEYLKDMYINTICPNYHISYTSFISLAYISSNNKIVGLKKYIKLI